MGEKTYIAIDLKSFYASVECVERGRNPLTTNLLVADVTKTEKTICLAVTPSLKAYGIPGRARLFEAVQRVKEVNAQRRAALCGNPFSGASTDAGELERDPGLAVDYIAAPPRMALYREYSARVVATYLKYVSIEDLYAYSIDEVFLDATPYLKRYGMKAYDFAAMLIREVFAATGITATAGIAENLYLCKVAMDITAKHIPSGPDGVRIAQLDELSYRRTLWTHRELTDFWMVGRGIAKRLKRLGLDTMGDIARCSLTGEEILYHEFGKNAQYLIDQAWGREPVTIAEIKAYRPESSSISSGQVLTRPYTFAETRIIVQEMTEQLALELVSRGLFTDQLVLQVGYDVENLRDAKRRSAYEGEIVTDRYGRQIPKHARGTVNLERQTSSTRWMTEKILELFDRILDPELLTRRLTIAAMHLVPEEEAESNAPARQLTLFDDSEELAAKEREEEKERKMQKAVLEIKERYGANALLRGTNFREGATARERNKTIGGHKA